MKVTSIFIAILNSLGTNSYIDDNGTINYQFSRVASRFSDISRYSPKLCERKHVCRLAHSDKSFPN